MERYLRLYNKLPEFSDVGRYEDMIIDLMESYQESVDVYDYDCTDEELEELEEKKLEFEEFVSNMKYGVIYYLNDLIEDCDYRIVKVRDKIT